ncbi:MAG: A/G-specific adenine glycosylase [Bacteroidetes bacterium]|nr:MAG: A/G-specific adenine glycosylase [Bacteroidota bacterium]
MREPNQQKVKNVRRKLLRWYRKERRPFLWRNTSDPYEILVSEIMLQQTQASRVQEKLPVFLERFPDFKSLAKASKADVIRAWRGMGYNNRAVRLQELARVIVHEYGGTLPGEPALLMTLPGIGKYTAYAVTCFGFGKRVSVVDVNIRRVLSRIFGRMNSPLEVKNEKEVWNLAAQVLARDAYSWNQALMELGATYCKARSTRCSECPVKEYCSSRKLENVRLTREMSSTTNHEKLYEGIPLRLWRGKIVEALRNVNGEGSISLITLGKTVKNDFRQEEFLWLELLVKQLERDGIAATRCKGQTVRVMLAE